VIGPQSSTDLGNAKHAMLHPMSTMNVSPPDSLREFVEEQVSERGYGNEQRVRA